MSIGSNVNQKTRAIKPLFFNKRNYSIDAPPHSLKDSNANPKVKTTKEERVWVHFLFRNFLGVKGHVEL
jgi:hypothetical protein